MPQNDDEKRHEPEVDPRACPKCLKFPCACPGSADGEGNETDAEEAGSENDSNQSNFGRIDRLALGMSRAQLTCSWVRELTDASNRGAIVDVRSPEIGQALRNNFANREVEDEGAESSAEPASFSP